MKQPNWYISQFWNDKTGTIFKTWILIIHSMLTSPVSISCWWGAPCIHVAAAVICIGTKCTLTTARGRYLHVAIFRSRRMMPGPSRRISLGNPRDSIEKNWGNAYFLIWWLTKANNVKIMRVNKFITEKGFTSFSNVPNRLALTAVWLAQFLIFLPIDPVIFLTTVELFNPSSLAPEPCSRKLITAAPNWCCGYTRPLREPMFTSTML